MHHNSDENPKPSFEGQRPDEDIILIKRQHPWVLARTGLLIILILFVALLPLLMPGGGSGLKLLALGVGVALVIGLMRFYIWFHTIYILTNHRVVGVEQQKLLLRQVAEVPLENIQNITHIKKGVGQNMFDFGDLQIQTSGSKVAMEVVNVDGPLETQQKIIDAMRQIK
jgi:membrane protein YdbS with pleckstrin-like domain